MIRLKLSNSGANEGVKLHLPATPAEVAEAYSWFERVGIEPSAVRITGVNSSVSNLGPYILRADIHDEGQMKILNELAASIEQMADREIDIFAGALHAESIKDYHTNVKREECKKYRGEEFLVKQIVPIAKQSKKAQREYHAKQRSSWNGVNPVTRTVPSGKVYSRTKTKNEARSLISYDGGKERANGTFMGC